MIRTMQWIEAGVEEPVRPSSWLAALAQLPGADASAPRLPNGVVRVTHRAIVACGQPRTRGALARSL